MRVVGHDCTVAGASLDIVGVQATLPKRRSGILSRPPNDKEGTASAMLLIQALGPAGVANCVLSVASSRCLRGRQSALPRAERGGSRGVIPRFRHVGMLLPEDQLSIIY